MNNMSSYFVAEKQESIIFIVVGLLAIGLSLWLWMNGHRLKSMAYPLVIVALMQIAVGGTVYLRTDRQVLERTAAGGSGILQSRGDNPHANCHEKLLGLQNDRNPTADGWYWDDCFSAALRLCCGYWDRANIAGSFHADAGHIC